MDKFTAWLAKQRDKRGWTQEALADKMELSQAAVSRVEAGLIPPTSKFIKKLADAFNMPADEVFRAAGFLQPTEEDEWANEMRHKLSQLTPELRDTAEAIIKSLFELEKRGKGKK